ncbi:MAG: hypothetical protein KGL39_49430 [Patescibacteria group bacterium]|nr:hypothetical protein [Patescibacteria group bacterium]
MRRHTVQDLERDLDLLWDYEEEGLTQVELAAREGQSQAHVSRRLDRARRYRAQLERVERSGQQVPRDGPDLPHLALVSGTDRRRESYYDLDTDEVVTKSPKVLVGAGVAATKDRMFGAPSQRLSAQHLEGQPLRYRDIREGTEEQVSGPTSYKPDPVLKGGVG